MDLINIQITDLVKFNQAMIEFDNTELIKAAQDLTAKYSGLVITEDMLISIGKERASLNKVIKSLEDARKKVKSDYNIPLAEFEGKIKVVSQILLETIAYFDVETSSFEEKRKQEKAVQVMDLITKTLEAAKLSDKYAVQLTALDKYLNKTESLKKIQEDLEARAAQLAILQDNEALAENARLEKVKNRELLIENLNAKYKQAFKYSQFEISSHTDEDVQNFYASLVKITASKAAPAFDDPDLTSPVSNAYATLPNRTIKITGARLENIDAIVEYIRNKGYTVEVLA
jgi:Protein of unknown function (DUF1351)